MRGPVPKLSSACRQHNQLNQHNLLNLHHLLNQPQYSKLNQVRPCKWRPAGTFPAASAILDELSPSQSTISSATRRRPIGTVISQLEAAVNAWMAYKQKNCTSRRPCPAQKKCENAIACSTLNKLFCFRTLEVPLDTQGLQTGSVMWCELTWCRVQSETLVMWQSYTGSRFRVPKAWVPERLCLSLTTLRTRPS